VLAGAAATVAGGSIRFLTLLAKQTLRGSEMTQRERERERERGGERERRERGERGRNEIRKQHRSVFAFK
jgi:hypothetical protein